MAPLGLSQLILPLTQSAVKELLTESPASENFPVYGLELFSKQFSKCQLKSNHIRLN
jgi:hypothetical protein